ncbi:MAG: HU family DNA-binding protein [Bacteroidaceae bacterium]|nr:HU family DNA-binding protein [Bacteroidaceae bacterium]
MAITYAVKKTKNPNGVQGTDYFHAKTIKSGDYEFEDLISDITESTTCTAADALAVLRSMKRFVTKALLAGQVVVLNDLGRLQVSLQGKCYTQEMMAEEGFTPISFIKGHRITFRPEVKLKQSIADGISLKRLSSEVLK